MKPTIYKVGDKVRWNKRHRKAAKELIQMSGADKLFTILAVEPCQNGSPEHPQDVRIDDNSEFWYNTIWLRKADK